MNCTVCGVVRSYVGVLFPARLLCACEDHVCRVCDAKAVGVEFQKPIKTQEPSDCAYWCGAHKPDDFPEVAPAAERPKWSLEGGEPEKEPKRKKRQAVEVHDGGPPHIDPAWTFSEPPPGAMDAQKVKCAVCKNTHMMRERRMWNGTHSRCPKCQELVTVFAEEV